MVKNYKDLQSRMESVTEENERFRRENEILKDSVRNHEHNIQLLQSLVQMQRKSVAELARINEEQAKELELLKSQKNIRIRKSKSSPQTTEHPQKINLLN